MRRQRLAAASRHGKLGAMSNPSDELSKIRAKAGALGGKKVTPKKRAHLASIASKGGKTVTAKKLEHLASIVSKGGKTVTAKKREHLAGIAAKGGSTVTEKKREHLRRALAARWAKAKKKSAS